MYELDFFPNFADIGFSMPYIFYVFIRIERTCFFHFERTFLVKIFFTCYSDFNRTTICFENL